MGAAISCGPLAIAQKAMGSLSWPAFGLPVARAGWVDVLIGIAIGAVVGAITGAILEFFLEAKFLSRIRRFARRRALVRSGSISLEVREEATIASERFREPILPNAIDSYIRDALRRVQEQFVAASPEGEAGLAATSRHDDAIKVRVEVLESAPERIHRERLRVLVAAMAQVPFARLRDYVPAMRDEMSRLAGALRFGDSDVTEDLDTVSVVLHLNKEPKIVERFANLNVSHMIAKGRDYSADFSGKDVVFRGAITARLPSDLEEVLIQYY